MSQNAAELCNLLIKDVLGDLCSVIFSYLLRRGRQPWFKIKAGTKLSNDHVRSGLALLIQHHLIYYCTSRDDPVTYFEANWKAAYSLVRWGKIIRLVEETLGKYAAKVVSTLLRLGHAKISHLEELPELQSLKRKKQSNVNGLKSLENEDDGEENNAEAASNHLANDINGEDHEPGLSKLHPVLRLLATRGYIVRVREAHFKSPDDNYIAAVNVVKATGDLKELKGKKLEDKIDTEVRKVLAEWTNCTISGLSMSSGQPHGKKRRRGERMPKGPRKRRRLQLTVEEDNEELFEEEDSDEDVTMDPDLVIRINYAKFDVTFRNMRLISLSEQNTSTVTSQVYAVLLHRIELRTSRCSEHAEHAPESEEDAEYSTDVPLHTISEDLPPDLNLAGSVAGWDQLDSEALDDSNRTPKAPLVNGHNNAHLMEDGGAKNTISHGRHGTRAFEIEQHLALLAAEPNFFCARGMTSGVTTYSVEYRNLVKKLRHLELERLIEARFGHLAVRFVRILLAKGRLDERRLQEISMLTPKDLRQILARMEAAGFVDLQEVPRDTQRQSSRSIYLWFYDPDRVRTMVTEDTYKTMSRCWQRLRHERNKLKFFLQKAERTDVRGNEERYLTPLEVRTLREWKDKEASLLGEISRLDDLVAVLRDY